MFEIIEKRSACSSLVLWERYRAYVELWNLVIATEGVKGIGSEILEIRVIYV